MRGMRTVICYLVLAAVPVLLSESAPIALGNQGANRVREAQEHLDRATTYSDQGDPRAEQEYLEAIAALDGEYPDAQLEFAYWLAEQTRFDEAAKSFRGYCKQLRRAKHCDESTLQDFLKAAQLKEYIRSVPAPQLDSLLAYAELVRKYGARTRGADVVILERTLDLYPSSARARIALAVALPRNEVTRSLELLREAVTLEPMNPEAPFRLGGLLLYEQPSAAEQEFRHALKLSDNKLSLAWEGLGQALTLQGRPSEAIAAYKYFLRSSDVPEQYKAEIRRWTFRSESEPNSA